MISLSRLLALMLVLATTTSITACDGDARPFEEAVEASLSDLASLSITVPTGDLEDVVLNFGQRYNLNLVGRNDDGEVFEVSAGNRRWVVADPEIASIDNNGTVTGLSNGATTVQVFVADVESNIFPIVVSNFSLTAIQRIIGETALDPCVAASYVATGTFGDGTERSLSSVVFTATPTDSTTIQTLSDNTNSLLATTPGVVSLTASVGDVSLTSEITVNDSLTSLDITPSPASVTVGSTLQMVASGTYVNADVTSTRDLTEAINWTIANNSESESATISSTDGSRGLVSGENTGSATINAECGVTSSLTTLIVSTTGSETSALNFNVDDPLTLPRRGGQFSLKVSTGSGYDESNDVTSSTDFSITGDTSVLTVGNSGDAKGIINPLSFGTTTIRAVYDGRLVAELSVNVTTQ